MTVPTPTYTDGDWGYDLITVEGTQKAVIVSYLGASGVTINFPATVGGYAVHRVGKAEPQVDWVNTTEDAPTVITTTFVATGLTFADGIVEIGHSAFVQCKEITGPITLPETLVTVGSNAFRGCGGQASETRGINGVLTIPDSVTTIGNYAFRFLTKVHQIIVGTSVTKIGEEAFFQAMMFNPNGMPVKMYFHGPRITNIGKNAFALGQSSAKVTCDVYSSGNWALAELPSKTNANTTLRFGDSINEWTFTLDSNDDATITGYTGSSTILDIPSIIGADRPVRYIGANAFENGNCTKVIVPASVREIEEYAFNGCSSLTQLVLNDGLVTIEDHAFAGTGIMILALPNTLQDISGAGIFSGCTSLISVTIGANVTSIGAQSFSGCTSLSSVTFEGDTVTIGDGAFSGCTSLTTVSLPFSTTSIGASAFSGCTSLTDVTFPVAVTTIGANAYQGCTSMDTITFRGQPTTLGTGAFGLGTSTTSVTATVKSNENWASTVLDDYKNEYTTFTYDLLGTKYAHLTHENEKIQVDSAIRDEDGVRIKTNYAKGPGRTLGASIPNPADEQTSVVGQALIVNEDGDGFVFGEAGKVDNVVNAAGQSVVDTNKIAHLPMGTVQLLNQPAEFVSNTDTSTNEEFPYRASVTVSGVSASTYAEVTYSEEQATSLNFATFCDTATNVIYLYSRMNVGTVTIPTISIGMDYSDITIDATPTSGSGNAVSSGGVYTALATKQDTLTFDSTPTDGSSNPVTSGGVYTALGDYVTLGTAQTVTGSKTFTTTVTAPNVIALNRAIVQSANSPAGAMTVNFMGRNSANTDDISRAYIQFYHSPGNDSASSTNLLYLRAYKDNCSDYVDLSLDATGGTISTNSQVSSSKCVVGQLGDGVAQFRAVCGGYGYMIRNDGSNTYGLMTPSGSPWGSWSAARPWTISNSTGVMNINGNAASASSVSWSNVSGRPPVGESAIGDINGSSTSGGGTNRYGSWGWAKLSSNILIQWTCNLDGGSRAETRNIGFPASFADTRYVVVFINARTDDYVNSRDGYVQQITHKYTNSVDIFSGMGDWQNSGYYVIAIGRY